MTSNSSFYLFCRECFLHQACRVHQRSSDDLNVPVIFQSQTLRGITVKRFFTRHFNIFLFKVFFLSMSAVMSKPYKIFQLIKAVHQHAHLINSFFSKLWTA